MLQVELLLGDMHFLLYLFFNEFSCTIGQFPFLSANKKAKMHDMSTSQTDWQLSLIDKFSLRNLFVILVNLDDVISLKKTDPWRKKDRFLSLFLNSYATRQRRTEKAILSEKAQLRKKIGTFPALICFWIIEEACLRSLEWFVFDRF